MLVVAGAVLLGHAPLMSYHLRGLWQKEQYQFFPFVLAAVAWLLWSRWKEADPVPQGVTRAKRWPWFLLFCSAVLLTFAILLVSGWLAAVSLNVGIAGLFLWMGQRRSVSQLAGVWCLLWLLVPLPLTVDVLMVRQLQRFSSQLSSKILDMLGIDHVMAGNTLELPTRQLFVDEACSGIVSVMSMVAVAMIYGIWRKRGLLHVVLLALLSLFWAVFMNLGRITVIAAAHHFAEVDLSDGAIHEVLGLTIFLLMFVALLSTDQLLLVVLKPIDMSQAEDLWVNNRLVWAWNRVFVRDYESSADDSNFLPGGDEQSLKNSIAGSSSIGISRAAAVAIPFVVLGFVQLIWLPSANTAEARDAIEQAIAIQEDLLPLRIGSWSQEAFESIEREKQSLLGRYSKSYRFRHIEHPDVVSTVALDFTYVGGWHDLCYCYTGQGWKTNERVIHNQEKTAPQEDWKYVVADLEKTDGSKAVLAIAGFDVRGAIAEPPSKLVLFRPWLTLRRRLLLRVVPQLFQVQVFSPGHSTSDESLNHDLRVLLFTAREKFRDAVVE